MLNQRQSHSDTLRRLLYLTKWQRHFKSSLTSMQEETDSITPESRTCQTLKLEKYLQLQNGRRERGHAWEGGVAHPLPGSTCFLSSTAPSLYLPCTSSFFTHSLSSSSSVVSSSPLLTAVAIPSSAPCPGSLCQHVCVCARQDVDALPPYHHILARPLNKLMFYGCAAPPQPPSLLKGQHSFFPMPLI